MQDIDRLGMLSINLDSKRQKTRKTICKSQRQTRSDKCEQLKGQLWETDTQNKQDAKDANQMVRGNSNKESIVSISEVLISQNLNAV